MDSNKVAEYLGKGLATVIVGAVGAVVFALAVWFCVFIFTHLP